MDNTPAPGASATQQDQQTSAEDLDQTLATTAELLAQMAPSTTSTQDTRSALAVAHQITLHLEHWQSMVASRRDEHVLHLWESGQSQVEIAAFLGVPKSTVHAILAERRALASPDEQEAYAHRAAEEFEQEARVEIGNLFAAQEPALS